MTGKVKSYRRVVRRSVIPSSPTGGGYLESPALPSRNAVTRMAQRRLVALVVPRSCRRSRHLHGSCGSCSPRPRRVQVELPHLVEPRLVTDSQHFGGILAAPARFLQRVGDGFHLSFVF